MNKPYEKKHRKKTVTNHQAHWLWGKRLVLDTLTASRWRVYELFMTAEIFEQHRELFQSKESEKVELEIVESTKLLEIARNPDHEGIVARVSKYPYQSVDSLSRFSQQTPDASADHASLVVILDRVQDPFTFSCILSCCQAAKASALIIGDYCQAQVTTQVARSSMGAVNHLDIIKAESMTEVAGQLKNQGFQMIVAGSSGHENSGTANWQSPIALMIGGDSQGLEMGLRQLADATIPVFPSSEIFLNPSITLGILLFESRRLRAIE